MLAVVAAVNAAASGSGQSPEALLDGFHAALVVPLAAAVLGVVALARRAPRAVPVTEPA